MPAPPSSSVLPPLKPQRRRGGRRVDVGLVVALSWLLCAIAATVLLAPTLGLRGIAWMALHHVLCVVGCTHELRRAWVRRRQRRS